MNKPSLLEGALLALTPLAALLPGCGGGGGGIISPTPTTTAGPTPTALVIQTPTPNGTVGTTQTSNFILESGQRAVLKFAVGGTNISGTLEVLDAPPSTTLAKKTQAQTRAFNESVFAGTYVIFGTLTPPRGYDVTVLKNGVTQFGLEGQLPTTTQTGTYTISSGSGSADGILGRIGADFPTPTPTILPTSTPLPTSTSTPGPTAASTPSPGPLNVNLTFTPSSNASEIKIIPQPRKSFVLRKENGKNMLLFSSRGESGNNVLNTNISLGDVKQGQIYPSSVSNPNIGLRVISGFYGSDPRSNTRNFTITGGTITVSSLTATTATLVFKDVIVSAIVFPDSRTETIKINGTISGAFSRE